MIEIPSVSKSRFTTTVFYITRLLSPRGIISKKTLVSFLCALFQPPYFHAYPPCMLAGVSLDSSSGQGFLRVSFYTLSRGIDELRREGKVRRNPSHPPPSCFLSFERNTARNGEGEERDEREVMGEETLERARRRIL